MHVCGSIYVCMLVKSLQQKRIYGGYKGVVNAHTRHNRLLLKYHTLYSPLLFIIIIYTYIAIATVIKVAIVFPADFEMVGFCKCK